MVKIQDFIIILLKKVLITDFPLFIFPISIFTLVYRMPYYMLSDESDEPHTNIDVLFELLLKLVSGIGIVFCSCMEIYNVYKYMKVMFTEEGKARMTCTLSQLRLFGITEGRGNFFHLYFVDKDFFIPQKHYKNTVDELNDYFLGTRKGDHYDEVKANEKLESHHEVGLITTEFLRETLSFRTYLEFYPDTKYHPSKMAQPADYLKRIRRACKIALEYFLKTGKMVLFALHEIDFSSRWTEYEQRKQRGEAQLEEEKSITQSEINFLIRKFHESPNDDMFEGLQFFSYFGRVAGFPWTMASTKNAGFWNRFCGAMPLAKDRNRYFNLYVKHLEAKSQAQLLNWIDKKTQDVLNSVKLQVLLYACCLIRESPIRDSTFDEIIQYDKKCQYIVQTAYKTIERDFIDILECRVRLNHDDSCSCDSCYETKAYMANKIGRIVKKWMSRDFLDEIFANCLS